MQILQIPAGFRLVPRIEKKNVAVECCVENAFTATGQWTTERLRAFSENYENGN